MKNLEVRDQIKKTGARYWQVAEGLKISDGSFSRKLRRELPEKEKARIIEIIKGLRENAERQLTQEKNATEK